MSSFFILGNFNFKTAEDLYWLFKLKWLWDRIKNGVQKFGTDYPYDKKLFY